MVKRKLILSALILLMIAVSISAISAEDSEDLLTSDISVDGNSTDAINDAISKASSGDTINLGENKAYDIGNDTIEITKSINIKGNNVNITAGSSSYGLKIQANNIEVSGITFINPIDLPNYGEKFDGRAIHTIASSNILIKDCKFINYAYGIEMSSSQSSTIENCWFNGATTTVSGMSGAGTKAIQLMGSQYIDIINNTFYGQIYDGLSIASNSGYVNIENNTFINNTFAIFYGGASTKGNKIRNNEFITCGMINATYTSILGSEEINLSNLPYIGLQKASNEIEIIGNTFTVKDNNRIIYSEAENTAHGYPSVIGAINITNNTVKKYDSSVDGSSVLFYQIVVVSSLGISTTGDIDVKDNDFSDIPDINTFQLDFGSISVDNNTIHIETTQTNTYLAITYVKDGRIIVKLTTLSGTALSNQDIRYSINSAAKQIKTTDEYGQIYIDDLSGDVKITASFYETEQYTRSDLEATIYVTPKTVTVTKKATTITAPKKTFKKKATKKVKITLKSSGSALSGKKITIKVNKKTYSAKTSSKGIATIKVKLTKKGTYKYTAKFAGDSTYKAASKTGKIKVK